jgi:hypothetical protein
VVGGAVVGGVVVVGGGVVVAAGPQAANTRAVTARQAITIHTILFFIPSYLLSFDEQQLQLGTI